MQPVWDFLRCLLHLTTTNRDTKLDLNMFAELQRLPLFRYHQTLDKPYISREEFQLHRKRFLRTFCGYELTY